MLRAVPRTCFSQRFPTGPRFFLRGGETAVPPPLFSPASHFFQFFTIISVAILLKSVALIAEARALRCALIGTSAAMVMSGRSDLVERIEAAAAFVQSVRSQPLFHEESRKQSAKVVAMLAAAANVTHVMVPQLLQPLAAAGFDQAHMSDIMQALEAAADRGAPVPAAHMCRKWTWRWR